MAYLEKKQKNNLMIFSIVVIIIFLIGISLVIIKDLGGKTCGITRNNQITSLDNTYQGLNVVDDSVYLQEIIIDNQEISYYENYLFCFKANISSADPLEINIYDRDELLTTNYFTNGTNEFCSAIGFNNFKESNNYLGFSCVNCDGVNNNLNVYTSTGNLVTTIDEYNVYQSLQIDYNLIGVKNCKKFVYTLFKYLVLFILLMSSILGVDIFIDYTKGLMNNGW